MFGKPLRKLCIALHIDGDQGGALLLIMPAEKTGRRFTGEAPALPCPGALDIYGEGVFELAPLPLPDVERA